MIYLALTLPPRAMTLDGPPPATVVFGAYHVHSVRSDGTGSVPRIARAAADAGLSFVILTDHGDGTRVPDPATYLDGVLVIDAVEIGTDGGHLVALGLERASPYALAGRPSDVMADVRRQGGWAVMAHPDSERPALRWRGGQGQPDGIEWLNADSEWRDDSVATVVGAALRSLIRPAESVVSLFHRPRETLARWDAMTRTREVVGLAAADAHGGIARNGRGESIERPALVRVPSYTAMFRTLAQAVVLEQPLSGDAASDARALLAALRRGSTFTVIHGLARPAHLEMSATTAGGTVTPIGGRVPLSPDPITIRARIPQAPGVRLDLLRQGEVVARERGSLEYVVPPGDASGAYRVEAVFPGASVPWIVSNPIYIGARRPAAPEAPVGEAPYVGVGTVPLGPDAGWTVERNPTSTGELTVEADGGMAFSFELGPGMPSGQYAALVAAVDGEAGFDRVQFVASADRPMRLSLQLRLPDGRDGLRWRRSVFVDTTPTPIVVRLEDLEPVGGSSSQQPIVAMIRSVLFVIDTVNTRPGASGVVHLRDVELGIGSTGDEPGQPGRAPRP